MDNDDWNVEGRATPRGRSLGLARPLVGACSATVEPVPSRRSPARLTGLLALLLWSGFSGCSPQGSESPSLAVSTPDGPVRGEPNDLEGEEGAPLDRDVEEEPERPGPPIPKRAPDSPERGDAGEELDRGELADWARSAEEAWLRNAERLGPDSGARGVAGSSRSGMRAPSAGGLHSARGLSAGPIGPAATILSMQPMNRGLKISALPPLGSPRLWLVTIGYTGTGWIEEFLLQVPHDAGIAPGVERPLLVAFHRFGNSAFDIPAHTDYVQATAQRGWFLFAPLGAATINFASRESQINTRIALETVLNNYDVDEDRLYAVGFSMGGGNALNFAARHTDLSGPTFAAVINHTGTLSQNHSYIHDCAPGGGPCTMTNPWEFWYGGTPAQVPFEYLLASVIDVPYVSGLMGPPPLADLNSSLARNLTHLPILSFRVSADPLVELVVQNDAFETAMKTLEAEKHVSRVEAGTTHDWRTLDASEACDWLAQHTRELPSSGSSLGFEDGRLFYFEIEQDQADAFSPFDWSIDPALGVLTIENTQNLTQIAVDLVTAQFDPLTTGLEVQLRPDDGTTDVVVLEGVPSGPTAVLRDGSPLMPMPGMTWEYDASLQRLTLWESDGGVTHVWNVSL